MSWGILAAIAGNRLYDNLPVLITMTVCGIMLYVAVGLSGRPDCGMHVSHIITVLMLRPWAGVLIRIRWDGFADVGDKSQELPRRRDQTALRCRSLVHRQIYAYFNDGLSAEVGRANALLQGCRADVSQHCVFNDSDFPKGRGSWLLRPEWIKLAWNVWMSSLFVPVWSN